MFLLSAAYGEELEEAIADDTSGHFERLLISVLQGSRPEGDEVDPDKAKADAEVRWRSVLEIFYIF